MNQDSNLRITNTIQVESLLRSYGTTTPSVIRKISDVQNVDAKKTGEPSSIATINTSTPTSNNTKKKARKTPASIRKIREKKRVSPSQLEKLYECLQDYRKLTSDDGHAYEKEWKNCAIRLNKTNGTWKNWINWASHWKAYKKKLIKKVVYIDGSTIDPVCIKKMSPLEIGFLNLIGINIPNVTINRKSPNTSNRTSSIPNNESSNASNGNQPTTNSGQETATPESNIRTEIAAPEQSTSNARVDPEIPNNNGNQSSDSSERENIRQQNADQGSNSGPSNGASEIPWQRIVDAVESQKRNSDLILNLFQNFITIAQEIRDHIKRIPHFEDDNESIGDIDEDELLNDDNEQH